MPSRAVTSVVEDPKVEELPGPNAEVAVIKGAVQAEISESELSLLRNAEQEAESVAVAPDGVVPDDVGRAALPEVDAGRGAEPDWASVTDADA
jgi:hypothetical protein